MSVADQQNPGVTEAESKLFNAVSNQRDRIFQAAVDEDVAFGGRDQVRGESLASDVVDIADHAMCGKRRGPAFVLTGQAAGASEAGALASEARHPIRRFASRPTAD